MSNTITFTFDNTVAQIGQTITLTQINSFNVIEDLVFTYVSSSLPNIPYNIKIVEGVPQGDFSANQLQKTLGFVLNPSIYSVQRIDNVVIVTSLTDDFSFTDGISDFTGVDISVDFNPIFTGIQRINVRSPFFISAPVFDGTNLVSSVLTTFDIYIYEGVLNVNKPAQPNYTYEKKPRYFGDNNIYIDISRQVSDFIDNRYNGDLQANSVFVEIDVQNNYSGGVLDESYGYLALNGYNLHQQNVNHLPIEDVLISNSSISVLSGDDINIPIYLGGSKGYDVALYDGETVVDQVIIENQEILNTNDIVSYANFSEVTIGDRIEIIPDDGSETIFLDVEIIRECIYDPVKITFVNRFGVLQDFYAYKVSKQKLKSTNDSYNRSTLREDVIGGLPVLSYQTSDHRKRDYNKQSVRSIELNTGYIQEDNNLIMEEMLVSENIWITIDEVVHPVNLTNKNISLLSKTNDQLIKYKIDFDYSYQEVQNIR